MSSSPTYLPPSSVSTSVSPLSLMSGLMRADCFVLAAGLLILSIGAFVPLVCGSLPSFVEVLVIIFDRMIQLLFVFFVVRRWRHRLEIKKISGVGAILGRLTIVGFLLWGGMLLPFLLLPYLSSGPVMAIAVFTMTLATITYVRYFFYFVTIGIFGGTFSDTLRLARTITLTSPLAPLRATVGPLAITALAFGLALAPYPDGRSPFWNTLAGASESLFIVLSTYSGLAFGILLASDTAWKAAGLDHYRAERLNTIACSGPKWITFIFSPRGILILCVLVGVLFGSNIDRQLTSGPAARVALETLTLHQNTLGISLRVQDETFELRGFSPLAFSLAGPTGETISTELTLASVEPGSKERLMALPPTREPVTLRLEFSLDRKASAAAELEDLWLWYHKKPILHLSTDTLKKGLASPPPAAGLGGPANAGDQVSKMDLALRLLQRTEYLEGLRTHPS